MTIDDGACLFEVSRSKEEKEEKGISDNTDPENIFDVTDGQCLGKRSICPLSYCRYHIAHGAEEAAIIKQRGQTCTLKMTTRDHTLNEVGITLGITRERVRQLEVNAVAKVARGLRRIGLLGDKDVTPERLRQLLDISRRATHTSYSPRPRKNKCVQSERHV